MKLYNYKAYSLDTSLDKSILIKASDLESYITSHRPKQTFYHGFYNYEWRESIAGYSGLLEPALDAIHIDLDSKLDLGLEAWIQTKALSQKLSESGCDHVIYFSGNKGFHIAIHKAAFGLGGPMPSNQLVECVRGIVSGLKIIFSTVDTGIYDPPRKFRAWRSYNSSSGLYKTRLSDLSLELEDIRELAKEQQIGEYLHPTAGPVVPWLAEFIANANQYIQLVPKGEGGRNDKLKAIATSVILNQSIEKAFGEVYEYDLAHHKPRLFTDASEGHRAKDESDAKAFASDFVLKISKTLVAAKKLGPSIKVLPEDCQIAPKLELLHYPKMTGMLGDIYNMVQQYSYTDVPTLSFASSLSILSVMIGHTYKFDGIGANLFSLTIAPSGSGKSFGFEAAQDLLMNQDQYASSDFVSSAALADFNDHHCKLHISEEFSKVLKLTVGNVASHASGIPQALCQLYDSALKSMPKPVRRGSNADEKKFIEMPFVSILGSTTPSEFSESINKDSFRSGLLARFNIFIADVNDSFRSVLDHEAKFLATNLVKINSDRLWTVNKKQKDLSGKPSPIELKPSNDGLLMLDYFAKQYRTEALQSDNENVQPLLLRRITMVKKLAIIHAVSRAFHQSVEVTIEAEDIKWAHEVVYICNTNLINFFVDAASVESLEGRDRERVFKIIAQNPKIFHRDLTRKTQFLKNNAYRQAIIKDLKETERIDSFEEGQKTFYFVKNN